MNAERLLENKVCLVTGCNKGIGKAIVKKFAQQGAIVFAIARSENSLDELCKELSARYSTQVISLYFDITDHQKCKEAIIKIKKEFRTLDILVNNAGKVSYEILGMVNFTELREMFEVNVVASINLMQLASKLMMRQNSGSIINISSLVGEKGTKGQLGYSATKGAVIALTKSASKDLAKYNIRVNTLAPGMIETERFQKIMEENFQDKVKDIGFGRLGQASEVADACVFLGSDSSGYITGQVIGIDGSLKI
jgi:3-oxoacyl-[acyl-carrier protein] reductase